MSNQFNYNLNSINFFIQENSGSITGVSTEFEDYGDDKVFLFSRVASLVTTT